MRFLFAITAAAFVAGCDEAYAQTSGLLTAPNGMTLYTFDQDRPNTSTCNRGCAKSWPPYFVEADAAAPEGLTIVERQDGTQQWAKDGQPLYFWAGDRRPGDVNGDGVGGVWHVAR